MININEERFPVGSRVRINSEYGYGPNTEYEKFYGLEAEVVEHVESNPNFIRIQLDNPPHPWSKLLLMTAEEIDKV